MRATEPSEHLARIVSANQELLQRQGHVPVSCLHRAQGCRSDQSPWSRTVAARGPMRKVGGPVSEPPASHLPRRLISGGGPPGGMGSLSGIGRLLNLAPARHPHPSRNGLLPTPSRSRSG